MGVRLTFLALHFSSPPPSGIPPPFICLTSLHTSCPHPYRAFWVSTGTSLRCSSPPGWAHSSSVALAPQPSSPWEHSHPGMWSRAGGFRFRLNANGHMCSGPFAARYKEVLPTLGRGTLCRALQLWHRRPALCKRTLTLSLLPPPHAPHHSMHAFRTALQSAAAPLPCSLQTYPHPLFPSTRPLLSHTASRRLAPSASMSST